MTAINICYNNIGDDMNNEVRAIIKEALDGSKELEEKLAEFHNKIEKNNKGSFIFT